MPTVADGVTDIAWDVRSSAHLLLA